MEELAKELRRLQEEFEFTLRQGVKGSDLCTMGVGGDVTYLIEPRSVFGLQKLIKFFNHNKLKFAPLGAGSNVLIPDTGLTSTILIKLSNEFSKVEFLESSKQTQVVRLGASNSLMKFSRDCVDLGLAGLEFAGGIPATLGGATFMNAGAHGSEMSEVLKKVTLVNEEGEVSLVDANNLTFSYRKSGISQKSIITSVELELIKSSKEKVSASRKSALDYRKKTQPLHLPSAGSIFKNPSKEVSAGTLIEQSKLKGFALGDAMVSPMHANWIVNPGKRGLCADVCGIIETVKSKVTKEFNVSLETEVRLLSDG
jgi:UDP-N-acetylmuramate dehydrogenase